MRMLDDSRDPTPLLKEIRDDKTATIIIHANASMSHTILLKASGEQRPGEKMGVLWPAHSGRVHAAASLHPALPGAMCGSRTLSPH